MKKLISCSILTISLAGCATSGPSTMAGKVVSVPYTLSKSDKTTAASNCPTSRKSWSRSNNRSILAHANACVKAENWSELDALGLHLAEQLPADPWGAYYMSLAAEGSGNLPRALWMSGLAIKKSPNLAMLHYQKARIEWALGEGHAAAETMRTSVKLDESFVEAHLFLANLYFQEQDFKSAFKQFEKALKHQAGNTKALIGAGESAYRLDDKANAKNYFQKAVVNTPFNWALRLKLAELYEADKNYQEALQQYRKVKELADKKRQPANQQILDLPLKIKELEKTVSQLEQKKISKSEVSEKGGAS